RRRAPVPRPDVDEHYRRDRGPAAHLSRRQLALGRHPRDGGVPGAHRRLALHLDLGLPPEGPLVVGWTPRGLGALLTTETEHVALGEFGNRTLTARVERRSLRLA